MMKWLSTEVGIEEAFWGNDIALDAPGVTDAFLDVLDGLFELLGALGELAIGLL